MNNQNQQPPNNTNTQQSQVNGFEHQVPVNPVQDYRSQLAYLESLNERRLAEQGQPGIQYSGSIDQPSNQDLVDQNALQEYQDQLRNIGNLQRPTLQVDGEQLLYANPYTVNEQQQASPGRTNMPNGYVDNHNPSSSDNFENGQNVQPSAR